MQVSWDSLLTLLSGAARLTWANVLMFAIGGALISLAIAKEYEPMLLIPIGVGAILANIPGAGMGIDVRAVTAGVQTDGVFLAALHRRDRRPRQHLRLLPVGARASGADHRLRLHLHEPGPHPHAADHASADDREKTRRPECPTASGP